MASGALLGAFLDTFEVRQYRFCTQVTAPHHGALCAVCLLTPQAWLLNQKVGLSVLHDLQASLDKAMQTHRGKSSDNALLTIQATVSGGVNGRQNSAFHDFLCSR